MGVPPLIASSGGQWYGGLGAIVGVALVVIGAMAIAAIVTFIRSRGVHGAERAAYARRAAWWAVVPLLVVLCLVVLVIRG
jgi:heme/copper-type cytochrome/quinol oxidase subunit 2